jgi:hypothetical protein
MVGIFGRWRIFIPVTRLKKCVPIFGRSYAIFKHFAGNCAGRSLFDTTNLGCAPLHVTALVQIYFHWNTSENRLGMSDLALVIRCVQNQLARGRQHQKEKRHGRWKLVLCISEGYAYLIMNVHLSVMVVSVPNQKYCHKFATYSKTS